MYKMRYSSGDQKLKSKPMLFSGDMVRALLDGRKTITRRIIKPQPKPRLYWQCNKAGMMVDLTDREIVTSDNPFGSVGDLLYVRETMTLWPGSMYYSADNKVVDIRDWAWFTNYSRAKCPSIHMPRWASRLTLQITDIRVERLQDISEQDALAEGLACLTKDGRITWKYGLPETDGLPGPKAWNWQDWEENPVAAFKKLWQSFYGHESWDENQLVWAISFDVHKCNVDNFIKPKVA
jgi:hypothetical protein